MKYLKYNLVDPISGIVIEPSDFAPNGRTHPALAGLDVNFYFPSVNETFYATCDDAETIDPATGIVELTALQYDTELEAGFNARSAVVITAIYAYAQVIRESIVTNYHSSEISFAVSVKVTEAVAATAAADDAAADIAAPYLATEGTARGITTKALALLVTAQYDTFKAAEANAAGVRGAKTDAVDAIVFDALDPDAAFTALNALNDDIQNGWVQ